MQESHDRVELKASLQDFYAFLPQRPPDLTYANDAEGSRRYIADATSDYRRYARAVGTDCF